MKKSILAIMVAAGACLGIVAQADEIQFSTLPETVQTTVIRETHIASPTGVVRVIHDSTGVYAVTVRGTEGDRVVYVNETGAIVQAPATTTTTTIQTGQPLTPPCRSCLPCMPFVRYKKLPSFHPDRK
jgi:hypothetical protein